MVDGGERGADLQIDSFAANAEPARQTEAVFTGRRRLLRKFEREPVRTAQPHVVGRWQSLTEFLELIHKVHWRIFGSFFGQVGFEACRAAGQRLIDFVEQSLTQGKPDQAA